MQILLILQKAGIVATSRTDLLAAAFSPDPEVMRFLLSSSKWPDTDIVDALTLQAAVLVSVDHLRHSQHCSFQTEDCFGRFFPANDPFNCKIKGPLANSADLLSKADECLREAFKDSKPGVHTCSNQLNLHGHVLCEVTNMEGLEQLQKFTLNTTGGNLGGLRFHALLVLKRLALNSRLFFRYLTALASNLWNGFECANTSKLHRET